MKILSWKQFCTLPPGTICATYIPYVCGELWRKGDTILDNDKQPIDFFYSCVTAQCRNCEPPQVDNIETRYGMYDNTQMVVYETQDIEVMKQMLTQ